MTVDWMAAKLELLKAVVMDFLLEVMKGAGMVDV